MEWQRVKEFVAVWYLKIAAFFLMQTLLMYVAACIVASKPVSVTSYVDFLHYCCHWAVRMYVPRHF